MADMNMNIIENVKIDGFWGNHELEIDFHNDVNFLIGVNGSGKTTVINMIAAALSGDFYTLDRLPFDNIAITLSQVGGRKKPSITIKKERSNKTPYSRIKYSIRQKASDSAQVFSLDDFEEERMLRRMGRTSYSAYYRRRFNRGLVAELQSLVSVSWLSIHRAEEWGSRHDERSYESSVDLKIDELSNSLVKYFSSLSTRVNDEIENFQKRIIISLIADIDEQEIIKSVKKFDIEKEKAALKEIFEKFGISESGATKRLDKFFNELEKSMRLMEEQQGVRLRDIMNIASSYRSHRVVQQWNELLKKQNKIIEPRDTFLKILNSMLQRKNAIVDENNVLTFETESGKMLQMNQLSSGEKQLLIILGGALLQQSSSWIYITDEPELSLHVSWQEVLVENVRRVNQSCQIICATHSPDIVSSFGNKVFDMEKVIK